MHVVSPFMSLVSTHHFLADHCREKHPEYDATKCAFVYGHMKPWEEFDQPLSTIHHEADVDDANDHSMHYLDENPDEAYVVDGVFYNDKDHYDFTVAQESINKFNAHRKAEKEIEEQHERMKRTAYDE